MGCVLSSSNFLKWYETYKVWRFLGLWKDRIATMWSNLGQSALRVLHGPTGIWKLVILFSYWCEINEDFMKEFKSEQELNVWVGFWRDWVEELILSKHEIKVHVKGYLKHPDFSEYLWGILCEWARKKDWICMIVRVILRDWIWM